jgi:UDP-glucose 4-epimerase
VRRIVHTAAYPDLTVGANRAPLAAIRVNLLGSAHVLEAARVLGLDRVVLCSSSALYANVEGGEDKGEPGLEDAYPRPATVYATTKQAVEDLGRNYCSGFGLDVVAVRFAAVFGPWGPGGGGIATTSMERWLRAAIAGEPVEVGATSTQWVYSKDAALGTFLASRADDLKDRLFNIGMGNSLSGDELAEELRRVLPAARISVSSAGSDAAMTKFEPVTMSIARARDQLDYEPEFPMPRALADYRDWLITHGTTER